MATNTRKKVGPDNTLHIYTRVSTLNQAEKGTSLESQLELGIKKAKQLKFNHFVWNEGGKSSHHEDIQGRPELYKLVQAIKAGEVKHLWVYDQSRLSRNDQLASILRYEFNESGVTLYTKDGQFDFTSPSDRFMKQLLDAVAQYENEMRAERTRIGKLVRVKSGFYHGGPTPYGYQISQGKLAENEEESKWVKFIFNEVHKGSSIAKVKKALDTNGVLARRGGLWSLGSLEALLRNTHYIGHYTYTDSLSGESIDVSCPKFIDETVWHSIARTRNRNVSRSAQKNATTKHFYLLRDLMVCGHCGRKISGRIKPSKSEYMYYCPNKERDWAKTAQSQTYYQRGTGCGFNRAMNIPRTDKLVLDTVLNLHRDSNILKDAVKRRIWAEHGITKVVTKDQIKKYNAEILSLQKKLVDVEETIGHLTANHLLKQVEERIYKITLQRLNEQRDLYKEKIENLRIQIKGETEKKQWIDWVKLFGEEIDRNATLSDQEKQAYLTGLIERIEAKCLPNNQGHELTIHFHHPIVGDKFAWKDPKAKSKGYTITDGSTTTQIKLAKRGGGGKLHTP
jgi:DNA invertase Pin-like site-specific DNA recombinase